MNIVILSGGSGKRLWPLSNDSRSKQFIQIFSGENGNCESMLQRLGKQLQIEDNRNKVVITASKSQIPAIQRQLKEGYEVCTEPTGRDTFPAIALTAAWLHDVKGILDREIVVVCPVDTYVEGDYLSVIEALAEASAKRDGMLTLLGVDPVYASEKYGYILPRTEEKISDVAYFKEKPEEKSAREYISRGALWNGGVFSCKLEFLLNKAHELIPFTDYEDLYDKFSDVKAISFDYAVVEQEQSMQVMRYNGEWRDLGTWNTLTEVMQDSAVGNVIMGSNCQDVHVINELNIPVLCMGLENTVVSISPDGILVSDKMQSSYIKPFVEHIDQKIMFAEKSWGKFQVLDVSEKSMTIKVTLNPGGKMNYHSHEHRDEIWNIISGTGRTIVDGMEQPVSAGDVVTMEAGCRHTIIADSKLELIEVQLGEEISVYDKQKYEFGGR